MLRLDDTIALAWLRCRQWRGRRHSSIPQGCIGLPLPLVLSYQPELAVVESVQKFIPTVRGVGSICDCAFAGAVATGLRKVARITAAKSDRPFGVK